MKIFTDSNTFKVSLSSKDWESIGIQAGWLSHDKKSKDKNVELKNLLDECNRKFKELEIKAKQAVMNKDQVLLKKLRFQMSNLRMRRESILESLNNL